MAGGSQNLKPWAKGVSGNPYGNPRLPPEIRAARKENQAALIRLVMSCFARTDAQMKEAGEDAKTTQLERAIIGLMSESHSKVDAFKYLTELVCGRIPDTDPESPAEQMTPKEKLEIMRRAVEVLDAQVNKSE